MQNNMSTGNETPDRTGHSAEKAIDRLAGRADEHSRVVRSGLALAQLTASWVDDIVRRRWAAGAPDLAVFALGGSGRGEMSPYSDIDLMFFSERGIGRRGKDACLKTVYALWDEGFDVGYSIRNAKEVREEALADVRTRNALLDARFITGARDTGNVFFRNVFPGLVRSRRRAYLKAIVAEREEGRREFGTTPFLLEPNVKESPGGLRDLQTALWLSRIAFGTEGFRGLDRILGRREIIDLYATFDLLWRIRIRLHLLARRRNDALDFSVQDQVACALGYGAKGGRTPDERLMSRYFLRIRTGAAVAKRLTERSIESVLGTKGGPSRLFFRRLAPPFRISKGVLICVDESVLEKDPSLVFRAFALSARHSAPLGRSVSAWIRANVRRFEALRDDPRTGGEFLEILKGNNVFETLRTMHGLRILGRYIPEFGRLQGLVVRDPFHRYTVDEHSLFAVRALESLGDPVAPVLPLLASTWRELKPQRHLLYLAALLHDVAKGGRSPHLGTHHRTDVSPILERLPLDPGERDLAGFLVREHLLLSETAQKREIEDPEVIRAVARRIGSPERLSALFAFTFADQASVRPGFWSSWREHLITDLSMRLARFFETGKVPDLSPEDVRTVAVKGMPEQYVRVTGRETVRRDADLFRIAETATAACRMDRAEGGTMVVTLVAPARADLFAGMAGVLAARSLNIVRAGVFTRDDGWGLLRFYISNWEEIGVADTETTVKSDLLAMATTGKGIRPPGGPPACYLQRAAISLDNETLADKSILEFVCADRIGLLYDVATLIEKAGGEIVSARITTDGTSADDTIYLRPLDARTAHAVLSALSGLFFSPDCLPRA